MKRFKFYLTDFSGNTHELNPLYQSLEFNWSKQDDECYYRKKINSTLKFKSKEDYDLLSNLDQESIGCDNQFYIVDRCQSGCTSSSGTTVFDGYLDVKSGTYDCDTCIISDVKPQNLDQYSCLLDEKCEEELNIFDCVPISARTTASVFYGEIECSNCVEQWLDDVDPIPSNVTTLSNGAIVVDCLPSNQGWTITSTEQTFNVSQASSEVEITVASKYCREVFNGANAPTSDFINIAPNVWVRPLLSTFFATQSLNNGVRWLWNVSGFDQQSETTYEFSNGICLNDLLECFANECNLSAVSNFFQLNEDNTHQDVSGNTAYTYAKQCLNKLLIYQKSDIVKHSADNDATIGKISFCKLKELLRIIYNVCMIIENNILRIEHISYFNSNQKISSIDLTESKYQKYVIGKMKYSYDTSKIPYRETWEWQHDVSNEFESCDYIYSCGQRNQVKNYDADCVTTDVNYLTSNEDLDLDGFVILSVDHLNVIRRHDNLLNGCNSFCALQENVLNYNRPLSSTNVSGQTIEFQDITRTRKLEAIKIPMCCTTFQNFKPNELIPTKLGLAEVVNATYDSFSETLLLELLV